MTDTKTKILDLAECYTQTRGFNGFSYIDLADAVGIKTSSIHYYFKCKDDLAAALVERVRKAHSEGFDNIEVSITSPKKRLEAVIAFFQQYAVDEKFCLCGMMVAELQSVSPHVSILVDLYFKDFQAWLARQFKEAGHTDAKRQALSFLSALEGSLLIARVRRDPKLVREALRGFLKT
ncbi:MAG: TetR/AcrR family transcriptional regulator [Parasphingorhabdus sp.]|uniref:TetR/AcrR family transcriptional regulator n=1 Tax=Parasphingorhabdus sp. TaxID=2709688 RepID=UPI00329A7295